MIRVHVVTPLKPSEDPKKVERAVRAVFPDAALELRGDRVEASIDNLTHFRNLVWKEKILDAARRILLGALRPDGARADFRLSKQAALAGHVSFAVADAPLGDLRVEVEGDDLEAHFKEIAPPTLRGRPVTEEQFARHVELRRKKAAEPVKEQLLGGDEEV